MTKAELVDSVAEKVAGVTKAQVAEVYDAIFDAIAGALKQDDKHRFQVKDFGTFEVKHREARKGRNPKTGEEIQIAASTSVAFRAASALKDKVS